MTYSMIYILGIAGFGIVVSLIHTVEGNKIEANKCIVAVILWPLVLVYSILVLLSSLCYKIHLYSEYSQSKLDDLLDIHIPNLINKLCGRK